MTTETGVPTPVMETSGFRGCQLAGLRITMGTGPGLIRGVGLGLMTVLGDTPPSITAAGLRSEGDGAGFRDPVKNGRCTLLL